MEVTDRRINLVKDRKKGIGRKRVGNKSSELKMKTIQHGHKALVNHFMFQ